MSVQMKIGSEAELRLATPDDLAKIGVLLPELGGPKVSLRFPGQTISAFCRWKYFDNPAGSALVGIAVASGRVVSVVAAVPKEVQVGSAVHRAFELGDFITSPEYRRQGLFSKLIDLVCDGARQRAADFVYVRPNDTSFAILVSHLSFVELHHIAARRFVLPSAVLHRKFRAPRGFVHGMGLDWAVKKLILPASSPRIDVRPVARFGSEMDELWENTRREYGFSLVRNSSYLNWRYADSTTPYLLWLAHRNRCVSGYLVGFVNGHDQSGHIVDLYCGRTDNETAATLVRAGMTAMLESGATSISTWVLPEADDSTSRRLLSRASPRVADSALHFAVRFLHAGFDRSKIPTNRWRLALGDFDGV